VPHSRLETFVTKKGFILLNGGITVKEALAHWKKVAKPTPVSHVVYVVDDSNRLVGAVELKDLLLDEPDKKLSSVMRADFPSIRLKAPISQAVSLAVEKEITEMAVVDDNGELVGMVFTDRLLDALNWMNTQNVYRLAGILRAREKVDLRLPSLVRGMYDRMVWLLFSVIVGVFVAGGILKHFETAIITVPAVTFFIPVLMGFGGNIGTQTSTVFVRMLSNKEAGVGRRLLKLLTADLITGGLLGIVLGLVTAVSSLLFFTDFRLALVLFISMMMISVVAILVGFMIPYLSHKKGWDPAIVSAPVVTSIKDVLALLIYFLFIRLLL